MAFAKKSFGQNFLTDHGYAGRIVEAARLTGGDFVIEVGPGRGALTELLLETAGRVIAVELDRDLIPGLEKQFEGRDNFEIISGDILKIDLARFNTTGSKLKIVANLPYNISTAALQRFIAERRVISTMALMFQREVVERITARPGSSERGYLTVLVEAFLNVEKLFDVPPIAFRPRPRVWSAVVRATPKAADANLENREQDFARLVSVGFRQKRKTILNNFKSASAIENPESLLRQAGIDPSRRAETLSLDEWKRIFDVYAA
jgi:16S rRNA (adenine1518-N6/adenine1519-N6)-dimethyltransferase